MRIDFRLTRTSVPHFAIKGFIFFVAFTSFKYNLVQIVVPALVLISHRNRNEDKWILLLRSAVKTKNFRLHCLKIEYAVFIPSGSWKKITIISHNVPHTDHDALNFNETFRKSLNLLDILVAFLRLFETTKPKRTWSNICGGGAGKHSPESSDAVRLRNPGKTLFAFSA